MVVDGVYRRPPLAGSRKHNFTHRITQMGNTWPGGAEDLADILKGERGLTPGGSRNDKDRGGRRHSELLVSPGGHSIAYVFPFHRVDWE